MKTILKIALGFISVILILAAVCLIVYAANYLPGWVVLPLSVRDTDTRRLGQVRNRFDLPCPDLLWS